MRNIRGEKLNEKINRGKSLYKKCLITQFILTIIITFFILHVGEEATIFL